MSSLVSQLRETLSGLALAFLASSDSLRALSNFSFSLYRYSLTLPSCFSSSFTVQFKAVWPHTFRDVKFDSLSTAQSATSLPPKTRLHQKPANQSSSFTVETSAVFRSLYGFLSCSTHGDSETSPAKLIVSFPYSLPPVPFLCRTRRVALSVRAYSFRFSSLFF